MFAIELPGQDGWRRLSAFTRIALRPALPLQPGDAALARRGNQLPSGTRARARRILEGNEATAIAGDDIIALIVGGFIERAADNDAPAVEARSGKARPVRMGWRLPSVAP